MEQVSLKDVHPDAFEMIAARFRVLADPLRLRLLRELEGGEKNVSELVRLLGASQPSVSKHLRMLLEAGIVARRQCGPAAYYHIVDPGVAGLCNLVCRSLQEQIRNRAEVSLKVLGGSPEGES